MPQESNITEAWLESNFGDLSGIKALATGGQKQVFSATHREHGDVVLKLMHPHSELERTKREIDAAASISSDRVPKILSQGEISSPIGLCYWFCESRVPGDTVRARLKSGPLEVVELLRLALQVCKTLVAAEDAGIVHRDVKPENIIMDPDGGFWLIDFGIARHLDLDSLTATAAVIGNATFGYAPLEQCKNAKQEIDSRADLFALGVTIFECWTGKNPFREGARDVRVVLDRLETVVLPRLTLPIASGHAFADLVATLTQRHRIHRPESARTALAWIEEICQEEGMI